MLLLQILRFASQLLVKKLPPGKHIKRVSFCRQRKGILYEFMYSDKVKAGYDILNKRYNINILVFTKPLESLQILNMR